MEDGLEEDETGQKDIGGSCRSPNEKCALSEETAEGTKEGLMTSLGRNDTFS